jgi:hypothetical protein
MDPTGESRNTQYYVDGVHFLLCWIPIKIQLIFDSVGGVDPTFGPLPLQEPFKWAQMAS